MDRVSCDKRAESFLSDGFLAFRSDGVRLDVYELDAQKFDLNRWHSGKVLSSGASGIFAAVSKQKYCLEKRYGQENYFYRRMPAMPRNLWDIDFPGKGFMKKLVIIPAFNEQGGIEKVVRDIEENAPDFDYVIINDCSTDRTLDICQKKGFHVINLPVNLGIGGGVQTGYVYAFRNGYDLAVQFDGDGQHNAKYLDAMAKLLCEEGLDMVIGSRYIKKEGFQSSGIRRFGIRYFTALIKLVTGERITDPTSGMRMAGRDVIEIYAKNYPKDYPEPESVVAILKKGKRVAELPVQMNAREAGVSSISPRKSVYYMIKVSLAILVAAVRRHG